MHAVGHPAVLQVGQVECGLQPLPPGVGGCGALDPAHHVGLAGELVEAVAVVGEVQQYLRPHLVANVQHGRGDAMDLQPAGVHTGARNGQVCRILRLGRGHRAEHTEGQLHAARGQRSVCMLLRAAVQVAAAQRGQHGRRVRLPELVERAQVVALNIQFARHREQLRCVQSHYLAVLVEHRAVAAGIQAQQARGGILETRRAGHGTVGEAGRRLLLRPVVDPPAWRLVAWIPVLEGHDVTTAAVERGAVTAHDFVIQALLHERYQQGIGVLDQAAAGTQRVQPARAVHAGIAQRTRGAGRKARRPVRRAARVQTVHVQRGQLACRGQHRHRNRQVRQGQCRIEGIEGLADARRR